MSSAYHRKLQVWQRSMSLVEVVYRLTKDFPKEELYGLTSQLRRASVSIPANIAEGNGRSSRREYAHFISIAFGSAREIDTLMELVERQRLARPDDIAECRSLLDEICRMLYSLRRKLVTSPNGKAEVG